MVRCMPRRSFSEAGSDSLRPPSARKTVTAVDLSRRSFSTRRSLRARRPRFWEATCLQRLASTCYKDLVGLSITAGFDFHLRHVAGRLHGTFAAAPKFRRESS